MFHKPAAMQKEYLIGQTTGLPQVMGRHDDLGASLGDLFQEHFDHLGGGRVETGGGFIQQ